MSKNTDPYINTTLLIRKGWDEKKRRHTPALSQISNKREVQHSTTAWLALKTIAAAD